MADSTAPPAGESGTEAGKPAAPDSFPIIRETIRPFRLVKYFSYTGFVVILTFTLILTVIISDQGKTLVLKKSNDYALLVANNLNHQVFLQFVIPSAIRYGEIRLRDPDQFELLDAVVKSTIHGFNVDRVDIFGVEGQLLYSTDRSVIGQTRTGHQPYDDALKGKSSSILEISPGWILTDWNRAWILRTYMPFRAEKPLQGTVDLVLGVFEISQDLTDDYTEITRFQYYSVAISLGVSTLVFLILRQILARGESIIEQRNEERRRLEEKLHQSQRLATLGQMVAAVAHEIRNPLGIISSTAEILQNKIKTFEPKNRLAEIIVEEARRLNGIVTEFLDFARPQVPKPIKCRLEDILDKNLAFLAPSLEKERIEVIRDYQGPESVEGDPDLLYRAFLNVFVNAVQAMPDGGQIRVKTAVSYDPAAKNNQMSEVVIEDTGLGLDPAQASKVFMPFFTTKNRGTGLGLAIVKNIIESHHGTAAIEARPEGGTKLLFRLPLKQR